MKHEKRQRTGEYDHLVKLAGQALNESDGSGSAFIALLSAFQRSLWEDLQPCRWYTVYEIDDFQRLPDWVFRNQTQPWATLRPMVEKGALVMKQHPIGMGMTVPIFKRPCCDRMDEYNGFGSGGPWKFVCPNHCPCHD